MQCLKEKWGQSKNTVVLTRSGGKSTVHSISTLCFRTFNLLIQLNNQKNYIGIELSPEYVKLSEDRIAKEVPNTLMEHMSE